MAPLMLLITASVSLLGSMEIPETYQNNAKFVQEIFRAPAQVLNPGQVRLRDTVCALLFGRGVRYIYVTVGIAW